MIGLGGNGNEFYVDNLVCNDLLFLNNHYYKQHPINEPQNKLKLLISKN